MTPFPSPFPPGTPEFLTADEAAELLRVPVSTLYAKCRGRQVAHYKVGRHLRLTRHDLEEYVSRQRVERRPTA